jgi:hypothetical protein
VRVPPSLAAQLTDISKTFCNLGALQCVAAMSVIK